MRGGGAAMARARLTHQVLVIDDDPHIAATIVAALKDRYQVHVATDEREGLAVLRRPPIAPPVGRGGRGARLVDERKKPFDVFELQERVAALLGETPSDAGPLSKARQLLLHRFDRPHTTESLARSVGLSPAPP